MNPFRLAIVSSCVFGLLACGPSNTKPAEIATPQVDSAPTPIAASPVAPDSSATVAAPAPPASSAPPASPTPTTTPAEDDEAVKEAANTKVASAVREKGGHQKCLMAVLDKHPGWKPKRYEIVVQLLADGHVKKIFVDKKKTDNSVPAFLACLVKQLEAETFPAPGREVSARLTYPTH